MYKVVLVILLFFSTSPNAFRFNFREFYSNYLTKNRNNELRTYSLHSTLLKNIPSSGAKSNTFSLNDVSILDILNFYYGSDKEIKKGVQSSNGDVLCLCPFHVDTNPSLSVNDQKGLYYCFSCNKGGSTVDFVMNLKNCDYQNAILLIADMLGYEVDADDFNTIRYIITRC